MSAARLHVSFSETTGAAVIYDLHLKAIIHELTDYTLFLRKMCQRKPRSVKNAAWRLARFWTFLLMRGKTLLDIDSALMTVYRDTELLEVQRDRSFRGSPRAAKQTVNQKVSTVLGLLAWLQADGKLPSNTIGPTLKYRVMAESFKPGRAGSVPRAGDPISTELYFPDAGVGGTGPFVQEHVYEKALEYIVETAQSEYIAERDALFVDIARHAGFRRGSINSLTTSQFKREVLEAWREDTYPVTPARQKRDYERTFEIPLDLALRVSDFIEGARHEFVKAKGAGVKVTKDRIFLSARDARPLKGRSMSTALRPAMRAAGAPKGKVVHALRGLFMTESYVTEGERRRENQLDTSTMSVALATAFAAGQKNAESIVPYVVDAQSRALRRRLSKASKKADES
jgi:integrase